MSYTWIVVRETWRRTRKGKTMNATETTGQIMGRIVGKTYAHKIYFKHCGLKWDGRGWVGVVEDDRSRVSVPAGCWVEPLGNGNNQPCHLCGTYCEGDCTAN